MATDKDLLHLQDVLAGCVAWTGSGGMYLRPEDLKLMLQVVQEFREAAKQERERFAQWLRAAAIFRTKLSGNQALPGEAADLHSDMAYAYNKLAHMLEENYMPELPKDA